MLKIFTYCHYLLKKNFLYNSFLIYFFIIFIALLQLISVVSIIPLITVLVVPELLIEQLEKKNIFVFTNFTIDQIKIIFGIGFLIIATVSQLAIFLSNLFFDYVVDKIVFNSKKSFYLFMLSNKLKIFSSIDMSKLSNISNTQMDILGGHIKAYLSSIQSSIILIITTFTFAVVEIKSLIGICSLLVIFFIIFYLKKSAFKVVSNQVIDNSQKLDVVKNSIALGYKEIIILNLKKNN